MSPPLPRSPPEGAFCSLSPPGWSSPPGGRDAGGGVEAGRQSGGTAGPLGRGKQHPSRCGPRGGWRWSTVEVGCRESTGDAKPLMPLGSAEMLRVEQEPPCPQRPLWPQGTIAAAWGTAEQDLTLAASHSRDLTPVVLLHHPRLLLLLVTARRGAPTGSPSMPHVGKKKHTDVNGLKRNCTELHQGVET